MLIVGQAISGISNNPGVSCGLVVVFTHYESSMQVMAVTCKPGRKYQRVARRAEVLAKMRID